MNLNQPQPLRNQSTQSNTSNKSNNSKLCKVLNAITTTIPSKECLYIKAKYKNTSDNFFLFANL